MYQAHYLTDKGIKAYLRTVDEELYRKHKQMYLNHDKHIDNICRIIFAYFDVPLEKIKAKNRQAQIIRVPKPLPKLFKPVIVTPDFFAPKALSLKAFNDEGAVTAVPATAPAPSAGN